MKPFETTAHIGPDGTLIVHTPADFANSDVRVVVEKGDARNGPAEGRDAPRMSQSEWEDFINRTAGSIPDFPDVERPGPDAYEQREPLD